jgi:hypothetical protein
MDPPTSSQRSETINIFLCSSVLGLFKNYSVLLSVLVYGISYFSYLLRYVEYIVLQNLEPIVHEYVRLQSQQAVNISWNCNLFLTEISGVQKEPKPPVNWLVQHGAKGKFTSFCCRICMWLLCTVGSCLLSLSSAQQFSVYHHSDNTCTAGHCSVILPEMYTLHNNLLLASAFRWAQNKPITNDRTIQMSHVHLKWCETLWYTMTRQIHTLRILCLVDNKN